MSRMEIYYTIELINYESKNSNSYDEWFIGENRISGYKKAKKFETKEEAEQFFKKSKYSNYEHEIIENKIY